MERLRWILIAGGPVIVLVLGGLVMLLFGYRGYEVDMSNYGQGTGAVISVLGAGWFVARLLKVFFLWVTK